MKNILRIALWVALTTSAVSETIDPTSSYKAVIVRVVDGDTIIAAVPGWPLPFNPIEVRLDGIDTPESRRNDAKCIKELKLGLIAKAWMKEKLPPGKPVTLVWTRIHEKFGRLLAIVYVGDENINAKLVKLGYAIEYHGATKASWCK